MRCSTLDVRTAADIARFRFREIYTDRKRTQQHKQSFYVPAYNFFVSQAFDNLRETAPTVEKRLLFGTHVRVGRVWPLATGRIIYPSSRKKEKYGRYTDREMPFPPLFFFFFLHAVKQAAQNKRLPEATTPSPQRVGRNQPLAQTPATKHITQACTYTQQQERASFLIPPPPLSRRKL